MSKYINSVWICLFVLAASTAVAQKVMTDRVLRPQGIMIVAVSRDYMFAGGIESGKQTAPGTLVVEPVARLTPSGEWRSLPCGHLWDNPIKQKADCQNFEREYLSKPHIVTVVSSDGRGTIVHTAPVRLSECFSYNGTGTYSSPVVDQAAIAASSVEMFAAIPSPRLLSKVDTKPILAAVASRIPAGLDSNLYFKFFSLRLGGQGLIVVQRSFSDYADHAKNDSLKLIFAIGTMNHGQFRILQWKRDIDDENQRIVGTIRLKNGREFLITSVSDPEGQWFRIYGIRDGKLDIVYSGGGSSC